MNLKKMFFAAGCFAFATALFAASVNESELKSAGNPDTIVFENYTGPHSVINSVAQIQGIGSNLGKSVAGDLDSSKTYGSSAKYSVIHCIDPKEEGKLDADIIVLGSGAGVDHIKNLRRIIASYLKSAYGYSDADSETVATFVTVYNAVYRGNLDYFSSKYKKIVTDNLTKDKAGLAISYKDWPGKTQIVIPLNDVRGGLSTIDTSVISDKEVVKSMQEEDDKGIDSRKGMVDIKEREADKAQEKAQEAQKQATEDKAKADQAQKEADQAKKEAEDAQKQADEAKAAADANPEDPAAQEAAKEAQENADQKAEEAQAAQENADQKAADAQASQQAATEAQNTADQKRTEAQQERTAIAQDQQQVVATQRQNDAAPSAYGLKAMDDMGMLSGLVRMNANNGAVIKESPVTVIRNRTLLENGEVFVAIAGITGGNGAVKLVQIAKETMEIAKESNEIVAEASVLVENGGSYYCVVAEGANFFVAKYSQDLQMQLKSNVPVKPSTPITVTANGIMVTTVDSRAVLLKLSDLTGF